MKQDPLLHKSIKSDINESLSSVVKQLQQERSSKTDGSQCIQSDSLIAQHFVSVLEAAFIHGLKNSYYDKRNQSHELPKPQFWNLVCKISHKDSLKQTRAFTMIKTRVGQCRAWLRLALNDAALFSYLTSLLSTSEHKTILAKYYEAHALFCDVEQADIFLRYLRGAENIEFDLACNSSMLNSWIKTPLELTQIITPPPGRNSINGQINLGQSSAFNSVLQQQARLSEKLASSTSGSSRRNSLLTTPYSLSPTISMSSVEDANCAASLPTASVRIPVGKLSDNGKTDELVEVHPQAGTAPSLSPPPDPGRPDSGSILHRRHIKKRRRIRRVQSVDLTSSGSSYSSCSSNLANSLAGKKHQGAHSSRSSSTSSNGRASTASSETSGQDHSEYTPEENQLNDVRDTLTGTNVFRNGSNFRRHSTPVLSEKFKSKQAYRQKLPLLETEQEIKKTVNEDSFRAASVENDDSNETGIVPQTHARESSSLLSLHSSQKETDEASTSSTTQRHSSPARDPDVNDLDGNEPAPSLMSPSSDQVLSADESIDIYAVRTSSISAAEGEESYFSAPCTPVSPGNSLLCGVGWSSEQNCDEMNHPTGEETKPPVTKEPAPIQVLSSPEHEPVPKLAIHREGFLQKKGDTLLFWRTRWFVLEKEVLSYYEDRDMEKHIGSINLSHVDCISDDDITKNKRIRLVMKDGVQHELAAESSALIRDWHKDLSSVHEMLSQRSTSADQHNGFEIIDDAPHLLGDDVSGSWQGSMKNHVTRIANEQGLDSQNYQCADCASPIGIIYGAPRLCSFTGQYYCPQCHDNEEHVIPARMIHNWDFRKHKVSKRSKIYLTQNWHEPCIDMEKVNPAAYRFLAQMKQILPVRNKLSSLEPYLMTCRKLTQTQKNSRLQGHKHMLSNPHSYSAYDLQRAQSGDLSEVVEKMVAFGVQHVRSCTLCSAKGFLCEICRNDEVIFAFDNSTTQCEDCKGVYHKLCLPILGMCPKCERRNARSRQQQEDLDEVDDASDA